VIEILRGHSNSVLRLRRNGKSVSVIEILRGHSNADEVTFEQTSVMSQ
jgi:hypothetical protein